MKNKKTKLIFCSLFLIILAILLFFNSNFYKKLKGQAIECENQSSITNEAIAAMSYNSILAEIKSDGLNEGKLRYVPFGEKENSQNEYAVMAYNKDFSLIDYDVIIVLKFDSDKTMTSKITLKEGLSWVDDGSARVASLLDNSVSSSCEVQYENSGVLCTHGSKIYTFKPLSEIVTLNIKVRPNEAFNYNEIQDAIKIEFYNDNNEIKDTKTLNVRLDFSKKNISVSPGNGKSYEQVGSMYNSYDPTSRIIGLYTYQKGHRKVYYDYIKYIVKVEKNYSFNEKEKTYSEIKDAAKDVIFNGFKYAGGGVTSIATDPKLLEAYCLDESNNTNKINKGDRCLSGKYLFEERNSYSSYAGASPVWNFPQYDEEENTGFQDNTFVRIYPQKIIYKIHGSEEETINLDYYENFKIKNYEDIIIGDIDTADTNPEILQINNYNSNHKEVESYIGSFNFFNNSSYSKKEKIIHFKFENQGVSEIKFKKNVFRNSNTIYYKKATINYINGVFKVDKDENWYEATYEPIDTNYYTYIHKSLLNLEDNEYITEIKFNMGNVTLQEKLNYLSSAYSYNKIYGIIYEMPEDKEITTNLAIKDVDYDSCKSDSNCDETKLINIEKEFKYKMNEQKNMSASITVNEPSSSGTILYAGQRQRFEFLVSVGRLNSILNNSIFDPIIYLRSETGIEYENIKIINKNGDVILNTTKGQEESMKGLTLETYNSSYDGSKIYKIDLSKVSDYKAALIYGLNENHSRLYNTLTVSFEIQPERTYKDNENSHYIRDMLYVGVADYKNYNFQESTSNNDFKVDNDYGVSNRENDKVLHILDKNKDIYNIKTIKDLNIIVKPSVKNEEISKEDINMNYNDSLDLKYKVVNSSGIDIHESVLYIPIPKKGKSYLNSKTFDFSLELKNKIESNFNNINVSYANINKNEITLNDLREYSDWKEDIPSLKDINFIKVQMNDILENQSFDIDVELKLNDDENIGSTIDYKYVYNRDLTNSEGNPKKGFVYGENINISTQTSNVKVINKDVYDNILDEKDLSFVVGYKYNIEAEEIVGYSLYKDAENKSGIIKENNNQDIVFTYRQNVKRKIKVHHLEKDTNKKLSEDTYIEGYDLDKYEISPEKIKHYKPVSEEKIKGTFSKNNEDINIYYVENEKYEIEIIYQDIYDEVLYKESVWDYEGEEYKTHVLDIEGYELYLAPEKEEVVFKEERQIVKYIYRSEKLRKVNIHYYLENTKEKIIEDTYIEGKDLDYYEITPKNIDGYILINENIIRGNYSKDITDINIYYKKKNIIQNIIQNPSTKDYIITVIILLFITLGVGSILLFVDRKKNN